MRKLLILAVALAAACATSPGFIAPPAGTYATNPPVHFGKGSRMLVQLTQPLGPGISFAGERFVAVVAEPVRDPQGAVVVPVGAQVIGHVSDVGLPIGAGQPPTLVIDFDELQFAGMSFPLNARVIGTDPLAPQRGAAWKNVVGVNTNGNMMGAVVGYSRGAVAGVPSGRPTGSVISLGTGIKQGPLPAGTSLGLDVLQDVPGLE
jgi:hypothetical protein